MNKTKTLAPIGLALGALGSAHAGRGLIVKVVKAIETTVGCAVPQNLRVEYQKGSDTLYVSKGPLIFVE